MLLQKGIFGCGTLQTNRKHFPKENSASDRNLKQAGDSDFVSSSNISVTKWRDRGKKSVVVASNMHDYS